jgi:2'-5' RNA ligase
MGFPPEGRPFRPHITLGRVREGHRLPPGAIDQLENVAPGTAFLADRVVLFESRLTPAGPVYGARVELVLS